VSAVLLGERLDVPQLVGGGLIVAAIALATLTGRPARA
jgi:drug/metabolite transporter (DMT)-like permease